MELLVTLKWEHLLLINRATKTKGIDHHLHCPKQYHVHGVLIYEVSKFLAPIPSETMHAIQLENSFYATHPIIISLHLNRVTSYFKARTPTWEEYEVQNILKIELVPEAPPWDPLALNTVIKNRVCSTTRDSLSALTLQQGENYLSTLSHCKLMMLQMLWMMTTMPLCWKVLLVPHHCK